VLDGPRPETERQELAPRDYTVLVLRDSRDRRVQLVSPWLSPYDGGNDGLTGHLTDRGARSVAAGPRNVAAQRTYTGVPMCTQA
jgi:hypothetical protein